MDGCWDRRAFLAGLAVLPFVANRFPPQPVLPLTESALPPRVVGMRSLGGAFRFDPPGLRLEADSRLVWLNMGDFHTTTSFHPDNADLLGGNVPLRIPEGAASWHSGMLGLDAGTRFEHGFPVPGIYDYFCHPHYGFGMVGRLVVGRPAGGPGSTPTDGLPDLVRRNFPPTNAIMGERGRGWEWASRLNGVLLLRTNESGDAAAGAQAVLEGIVTDRGLADHLGAADRRSELASRVSRFEEGVAGGADYEELVRRADRAKELL